MSPSQIVSIVRDALILAALAFLVFWIYRSGADRVKVADMAAVQKQLATNAEKLDAWKAQAAQAEVNHNAELQSIHTDVLKHNQPILVRVPGVPASGTGSVSGNPGTPVCPSPASGSADGGAGVGTQTLDLRPAISAFELKYETALSECRSALAQWPR